MATTQNKELVILNKPPEEARLRPQLFQNKNEK